MSETEQIRALQSMTGETDEVVLHTYLTLAGDKILHKAYPFKDDITVVPIKYTGLQVEIAGYLLNKRGAEGETYHSEAGVNRTYESASVPDSMLAEVVPYVGVV